MPAETPPPTPPALTSFRWDPAKKSAFQMDGGDFDGLPAPAGGHQETQDSPPPPVPGRSEALVARFLEAREKHWPGHPNFPAPTLTLIAEVERILTTHQPAAATTLLATRLTSTVVSSGLLQLVGRWPANAAAADHAHQRLVPPMTASGHSRRRLSYLSRVGGRVLCVPAGFLTNARTRASSASSLRSIS